MIAAVTFPQAVKPSLRLMSQKPAQEAKGQVLSRHTSDPSDAVKLSTDLVKYPDNFDVLYRPKNNHSYFAVGRVKPDADGRYGGFHFAYRPCAEEIATVLPTLWVKTPQHRKPREYAVFLETRRPTVEDRTPKIIDVITGLVGDDQTSAEETAHAELKEEGGLVATSLRPIRGKQTNMSAPGFVREFTKAFIARGAKPSDNGLELGDDEKRLNVIQKQLLVPVDKVLPWLRQKRDEGYGVCNALYPAVVDFVESLKEERPKNLLARLLRPLKFWKKRPETFTLEQLPDTYHLETVKKNKG